MKLDYTPGGYWDRRYREGRTSGAGSEGEEGSYKARYVNDFIRDHQITSVIDWGCGDGQVLELLQVGPAHSPYVAYTGIDVSATILERNRKHFREFVFATPNEAMIPGREWSADLALSMDVLFHLPDDVDFFTYLNQLFNSADRYVLIYSTNHAGGRTARHVLRREFTPDVAKHFPEWRLSTVETPLHEGLASFFVYEKIALWLHSPSRSWRTLSALSTSPTWWNVWAWRTRTLLGIRTTPGGTLGARPGRWLTRTRTGEWSSRTTP